MSDVTRVLEDIRHQVTAGPGAFDRLARRRRRRQRNRRIGTVVVALVVALLAIGGVVSAFRGAGSREPARRIDRSNVSRLGLSWTADLGGRSAIALDTQARPLDVSHPPVVADGSVFIGTNRGLLYAFPESCAPSTACRPRWSADVGAAIRWAPVVTDGRVFVETSDRLFSFPEICTAVCKQLWSVPVAAQPSVPRNPSSPAPSIGPPAVLDGVVYTHDQASGNVAAFDAATGDRRWIARACCASEGLSQTVVSGGVAYVERYDRNPGSVVALAVSTGSEVWVGRAIRPAGSSPLYTSVIIADGEVVTTFGDTLTAFPVGCRADCSPDWTFQQPGWILGKPVTDGRSVYVMAWNSRTTGSVFAFDAHCGSGEAICAPRWSAADQVGFGDPAVAGGSLFVTSALGDALEVYSTNCGTGGATCDPVARFEGLGLPHPPVTSGGLVYVSTESGTLWAFPAGCTSQQTCVAVWRWRGPPTPAGTSAGALSPPVVAGDRLFVDSFGGTMFAFQLTAGTGQPTRGVPSGSDLGIVLVVAAIIGVAALAGYRRRRFESF